MRLATFLEKNDALVRKVKGAMIYPTVIMSVAAIAVVVLLIFVIPVFAGMFASAGQALPLPTRIVIAASGFLKHYWWVIGAIIIAVGYSFNKYYATQNDFRKAYEMVRRHGGTPALPSASEGASIDELRQALHASPDNYGIGFQLYSAQLRQAQVDEALMTVRHFTDLPGCPRYFHFLEAEAWAAKQDWERAWKAREKFDAAKK
jgi:hypothetical protein